MDNYFLSLFRVDCSDYIEKKNGLSYVSWVYAWQEVKARFPDAQYKIYERDDGVIYWTDGKTAWTKVSVTINGIEHIEYLPIMDFKNKSIPLDSITSMDANKSIQRGLTKACARHGLGLYVYAGEDLPVDTSIDKEQKVSVLNDRIELIASLCNDFLNVADEDVVKDRRAKLGATLKGLIKSKAGKPIADYRKITELSVADDVVKAVTELTAAENAKASEDEEVAAEENKGE